MSILCRHYTRVFFAHAHTSFWHAVLTRPTLDLEGNEEASSKSDRVTSFMDEENDC